MRTILIAGLWLTSNLAAGAAWAQQVPPNETGVTMGHWHLNSPNVEASKKMFVAMGGNAIKNDVFDVVRFPNVRVNLNLRPGAPPANGGTAGSIVNHVGFTVPNVPEAYAKWKAAGVPVVMGNGTPENKRTDQAYVIAPDGLRIEILENKDQKVPVENEHVHFFVQEAVIPQMQAWYGKTFGAKPGTRNNGAVADLPGVQLRFNKSDTPTVSTKGRVLDHVGFDIKGLEAFTKKLEASGIKLDRPYTPNPNGGGLAFIYDPWGTYIELNEYRP